MDAREIRERFERHREWVATPIPFDVPGLGPIFIRLVDADTAGKHAELLQSAQVKGRHLAYACALAICDENGERVFDVTDPKDIEFLGGIDAGTLTAIFRKSQLENAQSEEGAAAAGNVSPPDKNSSSTSALNGA